MYFVDLKNEEITANFQEIFHRKAFYSPSAASWLQDVYGSCYDFIVLDRRYYAERPENADVGIRRHFYQDISESYNSHFYKALNEGLIDQKTYQQYQQEEIYYHCAKTADLLHYKVTCPNCGKEINLYLDKTKMTNVGGRIPVCPYCGEFTLALRQPFIYDQKAIGDQEIRISSLQAGAYVFDPYSLYPHKEKQDNKERLNELNKIILEKCQNINLAEETKKEIISLISSQNDTILHASPLILKNINDNTDLNKVKEQLKNIQKTDDANDLLNRFGITTRQPAALPGQDIPVGNLTSFAQPIPVQKKALGFCQKCGAAVYGKFCPECGTTFKQDK